MLSAANRLRRRPDFQTTVRRGHRAAGPMLVTSLRPVEPAAASPPRVGFVVSGAVGPATTRNLVRRRLRGLMRERLAALPTDSLLVVRANPPAAGASYGVLAAELDRQLERVLRQVDRRRS